MTRVAILGAGNGGCAAAVDLTLRGFTVSLYSRSSSRLAPIQAIGGLNYTGVIGEGFAPLELVTTDLRAAISGADLVMIVLPAVAHRALAIELSSLLPEGIPILLNPGSTGGALHVVNLFRQQGRSDLPVAETATLTYACRMKGPATSWIKNEVTNLPFAAFPGKYQDAMLERFQALYPNLRAATNVLATSLMNLNAIEHPPGMIMNAGWIEETGGDFKFYFDGVTPAVARVLEAIDGERMAIARAIEVHTGLPLEVLSSIDFFYQSNYTTEEAWRSGSMYEALQASIPNRPTQAAPSLRNRYLDEDVPYGLVPMIALAEWVGVQTPTMHAVVEMASALVGEDYLESGLGAREMGLEQAPLSQLEHYLYHGPSGNGEG